MIVANERPDKTKHHLDVAVDNIFGTHVFDANALVLDKLHDDGHIVHLLDAKDGFRVDFAHFLRRGQA